MRVIPIKILQYLCFGILITLFGVLMTAQMIVMIVGMIIVVPLLYLNLKWICRYPVGFGGMYFVNGMLSAVSFLALIMSWIWVFGDDVPQIAVWTMIIVSAGFWWWRFNVIAFIHKRMKKSQQESEG